MGVPVVVEAASEVLRAKDPPEMPAWLRRLQSFNPAHLRRGRAAAELLRGVAQVEPFRDAVLEALQARLGELRSRLDGAAAVEELINAGEADLGALACTALLLDDAALAGFVVGRVAGAGAAAEAVGAVREARKALEAAERDAASRLERARAGAADAQA